MSHIAILGATGRAGGQLLEEALRRGHSITAIARNASPLEGRTGVTPHNLDVTDGALVAQAVRGADAVISAVHFASVAPEVVIGAVKQAGVKRLLVVGGAGSLRTPDGRKVIESPDFPAAYKAEASAGGVYLDTLCSERDLDWTFLSPSAEFVDADRSGTFRLGHDELLVSAQGRSWISFPDFAIALIDELERPAHSRQRFTVGY